MVILDGEMDDFGRCFADSRDLHERELPEAHLPFVIERAVTGTIMVDRRGTIVLVNAELEKLFGHARRDLLGLSLEVLLPARFRGAHPGHRDAFFGDARLIWPEPHTRALAIGRDLYGLRKDGVEVPIEIGLNPRRTPEGELVLGSVVDITERKRAEELLRARTAALTRSLEECERVQREKMVLLQEVHHCVKNNLQLVSSLLTIQAEQVGDENVRELYSGSQARISAIGLFHESLYESDHRGYVDMRVYLDKVVAAFRRVHAGVGPRFTVSAERLYVPMHVAVPCGLIANELVSNAVRHGFGGRTSELPGEISLEMSRAGQSIVLLVADDGVGFRSNDGAHAHSRSGRTAWRSRPVSDRDRGALLGELGGAAGGAGVTGFASPTSPSPG